MFFALTLPEQRLTRDNGRFGLPQRGFRHLHRAPGMLHGEDIARRVDLPQQLTLLHMLVVLDAQAGRAVSRLTTHASHRQKRLGHTSDGQQERAVLIGHLGCSRSNRKARYNVNSPVTMVRKANNSTQRPGVSIALKY